MNFSFGRKKSYAFCGDSETSIISEVYKGHAGVPEMRILAEEKGSPVDVEVLKKLLSKADIKPGKVSAAFPLCFFDLLNISLPNMPDEAIEMALPYHLSKVINKPLSDFVYDWLIFKRQKDQIQVSVYLFSSKKFEEINHEFAKVNLELTNLEADVFAVSAFLDWQGRLSEKDASLCAVVWGDSLSFAVIENGRFVIARDVELERPCRKSDECIFVEESEEYYEAENDLSEGDTEVEMAFDVESQDDEKAAGYARDDSVLAGFDILAEDIISFEDESDEDNEFFSLELENDSSMDTDSPPAVVNLRSPMEEYFDELSLEVVRTRDYYTSVIKGKPIKSYFILGAEAFFEQLSAVLSKTIEEEVELIVDENIETACDPLLYYVALGTGKRW